MGFPFASGHEYYLGKKIAGISPLDKEKAIRADHKLSSETGPTKIQSQGEEKKHKTNKEHEQGENG